MKKKYQVCDIYAKKLEWGKEYLLWKFGGGQIGCIPQDGTKVLLFDKKCTAEVLVADAVKVAAIMQQMQADFAKKRKKKEDRNV